jgi:hypothetical protein
MYSIRWHIALLICFMSIASVSSFAQEEEPKEGPFTKRKPGIMRFYTGLSAPEKESALKFDRFNTDFFFNSWIGDKGGVTTKPYAIGHSINLMFDIPFSKRSRMGVAIGFGYSHFNVRHDGAFDFVEDPITMETYSVLSPYTGPNRWINRTVFNFIEVPFEIRFRSRKERGKWKFYPGFKVGYMVENYEKWRINELEYKLFNFPDLNRLHYGPTLRFGRDNVMLFGYYDMTYVFMNENSNQLQLFGAGISIGWF